MTPPVPPSTQPRPPSPVSCSIAPRLEDRYASYGVLASIVQVGRIAGGNGTAAVVRGTKRAHIGAGANGPGTALWVEVTEVEEAEPTDEVRTLAAEYKKLLLAMLQRREAWQIIDFVNQLTDPSALADTAGYASYLTQVQKRQLLETPDVGERLKAAHRVDRRSSGRGRGHRQDRRRRARGHGEDAEGIPAAPAARRDPQGTRRGRARRVGRLPGPHRGGRSAGEGPRGRAARGRQAGALERAEPGGRLDPDMAGHRFGPAVERDHRGLHRPEVGPRDSRRRPPRAGRREGPHRRVPGGSGASRPARDGRSSAAAAPAP